MICPYCGTKNEDTYKFCLKCGSSLPSLGSNGSGEQLQAVQTPVAVPVASPMFGTQQKKDLLKERITPADGEVSVRTYYCTYYLSRLLGLEAWGYLGITNKRIIFQALGTSNAGSSVIQSELPIADVSGISSYKGTFFSFGHLAAAFFATWIVTSMTMAFMTLFGAAIVAAIVSVTDSLESGANSYVILEFIGWLLGVIALLLSLRAARESIWKSILAGIAGVGFLLGGGGSLVGSLLTRLLSQSQGTNLLATLSFFLAFVMLIYAFFCMLWYARRPTFSLAISSKGGSDTPISISGASGFGLFNVSAGKALTAEPAADVELMLQELGAVVLDVQMLGDMGIAKWKNL